MPCAGGDGGGLLDVDGHGAAVVNAEDPVVGAAAVGEVEPCPVVAVLSLGVEGGVLAGAGQGGDARPEVDGEIAGVEVEGAGIGGGDFVAGAIQLQGGRAVFLGAGIELGVARSSSGAQTGFVGEGGGGVSPVEV